MARLIYSSIGSLDGYIADESGDFSWAAPDEEVHAAVNDLERQTGTMLLGRRMYQVLSVWETLDTRGEPPVVADFAGIWHAADKIVYSRSLAKVSTARTRLVRDFDPEAIRRLKSEASADISIGGPTLAAGALRAGLIDEIQLFLVPMLVGGGLSALPDGHRQRLELVGERRFGGGTVCLRYRPRP